jgi:hypothetical protein
MKTRRQLSLGIIIGLAADFGAGLYTAQGPAAKHANTRKTAERSGSRRR